MEHAEQLFRYAVVFHQLRKISAFTAVSDDDARTRTHPGRAVRARARRPHQPYHYLWARAVLLLRGAHRIYPCACRGICLDHAGRHRLDVRLVPIAKACRLWPQSPRHLRGLALRRDSTLSSLPLVCLAQARAARMVEELSLRRPAHGTVNAAADNVSAQPAASGKMQSPLLQRLLDHAAERKQPPLDQLRHFADVAHRLLLVFINADVPVELVGKVLDLALLRMSILESVQLG